LFQEIRDNLPEIKAFIGELTKLVPIFIDLVLKAIEYKELIIGLSLTFVTLTGVIRVATAATALFTGAISGPVIVGIVAGIAAITAAYSVLGTQIQDVINKQNQFKSGTPGGSNAGGTVPLGEGSPISAAGGKVGIIGKVAPEKLPKIPVEVPTKPGSLKVDIEATISADSLVKQINAKLKNQGSALRIQ